MATDKIIVSNLESDKIEFATVFNTKDGKAAEKAESFTLTLGSKDDADDASRAAGKLQPRQEVPDWAVPHLRRSAFFRQLESVNHIAVSRTA